jgi:hypothetical protein
MYSTEIDAVYRSTAKEIDFEKSRISHELLPPVTLRCLRPQEAKRELSMISTWIDTTDEEMQLKHTTRKSDEHGPHKLHPLSFSLNVQLKKLIYHEPYVDLSPVTRRFCGSINQPFFGWLASVWCPWRRPFRRK